MQELCFEPSAPARETIVPEAAAHPLPGGLGRTWPSRDSQGKRGPSTKCCRLSTTLVMVTAAM